VNVAVIGGAGAIGRAATMELELTGHTAVTMDLPGTDVQVEIDVRKPDSVDDALSEAELEELDALVYVAGVQIAAGVTRLGPVQWDELFDVNVRGAWLCVRAALRWPLRSVVLVSSIAGLGNGGPGLVAYGASKAALIGLARGLAVELAPIRVNAVAPGWTDTAFNEPVMAYMGGRQLQEEAIEEEVPLRRQATPTEIAQGIVYALEATYMTGHCLVLDGGRTLV